jgi:hypothetical protein
MYNRAMGKATHAREDLLRDAVALVARAAIQMESPGRAGGDETIVVGFRREGAFSIFFGEEPVFHFTSGGELRRAFVDGRIIKVESGRLCEALKGDSGGRVQLVARPFSEDESAHLLRAIADRINELEGALASGRFTLVGQVPAGEDVPGRSLAFMRSLPAALPIAKSSHVK